MYKRQGAWYDKSLLEKVVFNLLSNAFKYTPADGKVSLVLKKLLKANLPPEKAAHLPAGEKFVHLIVTDTGKGIPESEMTNIFAPFYPVSYTHLSVLAIAHSFIPFCISRNVMV